MKFITCNFQGRLGNLMYEIAATLATAYKNDMVPCFPKTHHRYYNDLPAFREYILPIIAQFPTDEGIEFQEYHEPADFAYRDLKFTESTRLNGYFTTSLYFKDCPEVLDVFRTHEKEVEAIYKSLTRNNTNQLVSVHVRRTDYVTDYGWDLPVNYYHNALAMFSKNFSTFIIFSDDILWCRHNFRDLKNVRFVTERDYLELLVMGKMDAHIIANSTFSAMAAILGDPEQKKQIIAPKAWTPVVHNPNIHEPHWVLI